MSDIFIIFVLKVGETHKVKNNIEKKQIILTKYLVSSKKTIIFVLKVGETHKVKEEILNIKNYDRQN